MRLQVQHNSALGIPMAHLTCNEAPIENEHIQADHPSLDERLIQCVEHTRAMHQEDNKALHSLLKSKTVNGPLWTFVESFETAQDGCRVHLSVCSQLEGPNSVNNSITKAHNEMQNKKVQWQTQGQSRASNWEEG